MKSVTSFSNGPTAVVFCTCSFWSDKGGAKAGDIFAVFME